MITAIDEKDAEGYIQTLSDYFIKSRYGDKEFIRQNMMSFDHVILLEIKVVAIKSYTSIVDYRLIHTSESNKKTTFYGEIILEKTQKGWKVYSLSEGEEDN